MTTRLVITVSFLPIFTLEAQEGRMFKPLAYTKTFSMAAAGDGTVPLGQIAKVRYGPERERRLAQEGDGGTQA